jgi:hypothetical protein
MIKEYITWRYYERYYSSMNVYNPKLSDISLNQLANLSVSSNL